ncbi:hypothetical protein SASPL_129995 [Salvia splendens]|uniref:Uncharacterized protein n=1 Tax=Salvia splendens TaxID=180675 RepID=A0A8X8X7A1_SALSN|nr:hypothetical protein SASPL_129995 [Salvia splendens]
MIDGYAESSDGDAESGMVNFTDMKRVDLIKEIAAEFELIANRLSETEVATGASVVELEPQHLAEIAKRAQKLTGSKNVNLKTVIDKSLLPESSSVPCDDVGVRMRSHRRRQPSRTSSHLAAAVVDSSAGLQSCRLVFGVSKNRATSCGVAQPELSSPTRSQLSSGFRDSADTCSHSGYATVGSDDA